MFRWLPWKFLVKRAAVRTLLLLSADDLVPGPCTYRRFWFRDACLMLHPMLAIGHVTRAGRIMMMRNCFVREESNLLVIGSGILPEWRTGGGISYGPTLTAWGPVSVQFKGSQLTVDAAWRGAAPPLRIAVPGFIPIDASLPDHVFQLQVQ